MFSFISRNSQVHGGAIAPLCQRGDVTTEDPTTTTTTTSTAPSTTSTTTMTPPVTECPGDWTEFDKSCYRVYQLAMSWPSAEAACREYHPAAHLASVSSREENKIIASMYGGCCYVWLGGSDFNTEGNWTWSDGSSMDWTYWWQEEGQGGPQENCLALHTYLGTTSRDYWFDYNCTDHFYFICEINMGL